MARKHGYKVKITGWLPIDKKDLDTQAKAIAALKSAKERRDYEDLFLSLRDVSITDISQSSYDPDALKAEQAQVAATKRAKKE